MEEIYVPEDFSDLREILPPNDEIIYSTLCTIRFSYKTFNNRGKQVKSRSKYNSHVLITQKGLAYFRQYPETETLTPFYNTLLNISNVLGKDFKVFHTDHSQEKKTLNFRIIQHPNFESKATFKERGKKFKMILTSYMINTAKTFLTYIIKNKDQARKDDSPLWKISKDFFAFNMITLDERTREKIEPIVTQISKLRKTSKLTKKLNLAAIKHILEAQYKIAYGKYILNRGKLQTILCLKNLKKKDSIFGPAYIKFLQNLVSKQTRSLDREKRRLKIAQ